ncbi:MAG: O-antigen ligase family protein [Clostridium chrysemydis]|uniref:O-antigen ligase family protein n=1 Tax=Clostridium TaxID=1485 RepID=UPI0021526174|nr:O-antigen ligase family protein [Clostridium sp. LY3-2]MCR6513736.1 O-antigen ligase family protein [Clostridium sp. LY3-2]
MEVTVIGWIVIALSIYGLIKSEKFLLYITVFFSTFTAASALNIEKTVTGIAPFYICGGLWIIKTIISNKNLFTLNNLKFELKTNKLIRALLIFIIVIVVGELLRFFNFMPITYNDLNANTSNNISFTGSNITQPIYLFFMLVIAMLISITVKEKRVFKNIIISFAMSSIFAIVWGILQFCMYYLNIEYPAYLFNNNIALGQLYFQMVYGIKRVNSIALEPSTFALNLLQFLPLILVLWLANKKISKSEKKSNIVLILIIFITLAVAVLTTSSTAYLGIGILIIATTIYVYVFSIKGEELYQNRNRILIFYIIGLISLIAIYILAVKVFNIYWGTLVDAFRDMTVNKKNLESGQLRGNAVEMSLSILKQSPLFGAGFGSFRSLDTITNLLANTGILGILSYIYIIFITIKQALVKRKNNETMSVILILMVLMPTIGLCISIPDLNFGYYWIIISVTYSYFNLKRRI